MNFIIPGRARAINSAVTCVFLALSQPGSSIAALPMPDNGWMYDIKSKQTGLCFSMEKVGSDSVLSMASCDGSNAQRFQVTKNADGSYAFRSQIEAGRTCLVAKNGGSIGLSLCNENDRDQKWLFTPGNVGYRIESQPRGVCITSPETPSAAIEAGCDDNVHKIFEFTKFQHSPFDQKQSGEWSNVIKLGLVPSSAAVLPNGKILYWSGSGAHSFHDGGVTQTYTGIFDPTTDLYTEKVVDTGHEMFCPGEVLTSDGRVLIVGGGGSNNKRDRVSSYDYRTDTWKQESSLTVPRWYAGATVLGDGRVFTVGGDGDGDSKHANMEKLGEIWSPTQSHTTSWKLLTNITEPQSGVGGDYGLARLQYYRKTFLAPDGRLLEIAPSPVMRWHNVTGTGDTTVASIRSGQKNAQGALAVQFSSDKVLLTGGSIAFGDENVNAVETNYPAYKDSYIVDLKSGTSTVAAAMRYPRYQGNGVVLPDGNVLAIGGASKSKLFDDTEAIMAPELYDPKANAWTVMAPMAKPRIYHSTAVLMPDGRVWVAGGGQCGSCTVNQASAEIYSPPYLFRGSRPTIHSTQEDVKYGSTFNVTAHAENSAIKRFTLVRLSAVTHSTNTDQRFLELSFTDSGNGRYDVAAPTNGNVAPPGYYMLFAINSAGMPSVATMIKVG
ncbi:galactose oxidase-like domain-containing protein [Burkholderia ubonensis]|uniref:galactose oxidase-like domain-containing protein n=1 Tax=Burkholderia ubonensis TaxID=101571 RepID=UPI0009B35A0E|nr:galactose oxidase-like domain-containing protein [Burkholderia ubonensis]